MSASLTAGKKKKGVQPHKVTKSSSADSSEKSSWLGILTLGFIAFIVGYLNSSHVANLFENDRHFSHLSNLEREMTFRTEMGLYYSYFKTIVEADSLVDGTYQLYRNNITEFPLVINTLKRFNLYPELFAGALYRSLNYMGLLNQQCWTVNRGENMGPVQSCEGSKDPPNFYINIVWATAGLTTALMFLLGYVLSDSIFGGLLPVVCFFYNHGECTRVMWTPPLRESFAFPICMAQILAVSITTRNSRPGWKNILSISVTTTLFIICWQFAQFMLFTQTCAIFAIYILGVLNKDTMHTILVAQVIGLLNAVALMFGNEMLFTSWLFSCLLATLIITLPLDGAFNYLPTIPRIVTSVVSFFGLTFVTKVAIAKAFHVQDDAHVFELLKSKFTDFKNFHTLLYTCAVEFDFLGWEMPLKTTQTLLLPCAVLATFMYTLNYLQFLWKKFKNEETNEKIDPASFYNILQMSAYAVMAILIMRLKLFFTPHLCIITSLLASKKYITVFKSREIHLAVLVGLVACMSLQGIANIKEQRQIMGEYQNIGLEELIEWINQNLPKNAVLAGPMPTMANLLLSTGRPIVNHPHYEDVGVRERTKKVYTVFSRKMPTEVYKNLVDLKVEYLVLSSPWCLTTSRNGCALTEVWDIEEPELKEQKSKPVCPILWNKTPVPFVKVFMNSDYAVLRVTPKTLELVPPKTRGI